MAVDHNLLPRIVKSGLGVLPPAVGIAALAGALAATAAGPQPQLVVSPFEWRKLMTGARGSVFPVFKEFEGFATPPAVNTAATAPAAVSAREPQVRSNQVWLSNSQGE